VSLKKENVNMKSKLEFYELERMAWRENNPLHSELVAMRQELIHLLRIANSVASRYDCVVNNAFEDDDYASVALWATFINHIDSLERDLGEDL
jgi:hypothetical protein